MHPDLETALAGFELAEAGFVELAAELTDREFNWRPSPRKWSVGQCIDHVANTDAAMLPLIERAVASARQSGTLGAGPFKYGWIAGWFLRETSPGGIRMSAPPPYQPSLTELDPAGTLAHYRSVATNLATATRSADGLDLKRVRVPSVALRLLRFPLGIWLLSLSGHELRHLAQASGVHSTTGFGSIR